MFTTEYLNNTLILKVRRVKTIIIVALLVQMLSLYMYAVTKFIFHILFLSCPPFQESVALSQRAHEMLTL